MVKHHEYLSAAFALGAAATGNIVLAPAAGLSIWVFGLLGALAADGTVRLHDSTPTNYTGNMPLFVAGNNTICLPVSGNPHIPWFKCDDATILQATLVGVGATFTGSVVYALVPADLA